MNPLHPQPAPARRALLARGMRLGALALVSTVVSRRVLAADKLPKSAVQYDESKPLPGHDCDDCTQFVPGAAPSTPGTCRIVAGDISPHGHCVAFTPKPKG